MPVTDHSDDSPADAMLLDAARFAFADAFVPRIGIAVSGGGDSMALLHLYAHLAQRLGFQIFAVTVDHGLRPEAADEAVFVAEFCAARGISHHVLRWTDWDKTGNLMAAARDARYRLIAKWAAEQGIAHVVLGHTTDDVAENFLIRLARKSGPDGLAVMDARFHRHGIAWARPLSQQSRANLRGYLQRHGVAWVDDPTNDDPSYDRTRARRTLETLAPLGISTDVLTTVSTTMGRARDALNHYAQIEARRYVVQGQGDLVLRLGLTGPLPDETKRRLWLAAVKWINGADHPPRQAAFFEVIHGLTSDGTVTVGGCLITRNGDNWRVTRELKAVQEKTCTTSDIWDGRWRLDGPHTPGLQVRALGEGIRDCPEWRDTGLPRASLMATPAVWHGDALIAAPMARLTAGWTAQIVSDFHSSAFAH